MCVCEDWDRLGLGDDNGLVGCDGDSDLGRVVEGSGIEEGAGGGMNSNRVSANGIGGREGKVSLSEEKEHLRAAGPHEIRLGQPSGLAGLVDALQ